MLDKLKELYWQDHLTFEQIASKTGYNWWDIKELFKYYKVPTMTLKERGVINRAKDYKLLYDLHVVKKLSQKQIYREYGYSPLYIRQTLKENSK